jgi:hypothetical protein
MMLIRAEATALVDRYLDFMDHRMIHTVKGLLKSFLLMLRDHGGLPDAPDEFVYTIDWTPSAKEFEEAEQGVWGVSLEVAPRTPGEFISIVIKRRKAVA